MPDSSLAIIPDYVEPSDLEKFKELTPQKRMFAFRYLEDYNHRDAAVAIGLVPSRGIGLLNDPGIREFIDHLQETLQKHSVVSRHMVESNYLDILSKAIGNEPISMVDKDGAEFTAKKTNLEAALRANAELGKHAGYDKSGSGGLVNVNLNFESFGVKPEAVKVTGITVEGELAKDETD